MEKKTIWLRVSATGATAYDAYPEGDPIRDRGDVIVGVEYTGQPPILRNFKGGEIEVLPAPQSEKDRRKPELRD